jgi:hypothetical protein
MKPVKSLYVPGRGPTMATWFADFELGVTGQKGLDTWCVVHRRSGWELRGRLTLDDAFALAERVERLDWDFDEQAECPEATMSGLLDALGVPA